MIFLDPVHQQIEEQRTVNAVAAAAAAQGATREQIGAALARYYAENDRDLTSLRMLREQLHAPGVRL